MINFLHRRVISSCVQVARDGCYADNGAGAFRWKNIAFVKGLSVESVEKCFPRFSIRKYSSVSVQRLSNSSKTNHT